MSIDPDSNDAQKLLEAGGLLVFELDYNELAKAFGCPVEDVEQEIRVIAAVRAYWLRHVSFEQARASCGLDADAFIEQLSRRGALYNDVVV